MRIWDGNSLCDGTWGSNSFSNYFPHFPYSRLLVQSVFAANLKILFYIFSWILQRLGPPPSPVLHSDIERVIVVMVRRRWLLVKSPITSVMLFTLHHRATMNLCHASRELQFQVWIVFSVNLFLLHKFLCDIVTRWQSHVQNFWEKTLFLETAERLYFSWYWPPWYLVILGNLWDTWWWSVITWSPTSPPPHLPTTGFRLIFQLRIHSGNRIYQKYVFLYNAKLHFSLLLTDIWFNLTNIKMKDYRKFSTSTIVVILSTFK